MDRACKLNKIKLKYMKPKVVIAGQQKNPKLLNLKNIYVPQISY